MVSQQQQQQHTMFYSEDRTERSGFFLSFCQRKIKRGVKCFGRQYVAVVTSSMQRRHSVVQSKRKVLVSEQATTFPLKSFSVSSLVQTFLSQNLPYIL